uniref:EF-hand domain-containing protein n=1 Tax=Monopterus albus TaxID=43700 RepID=A0A3Q3K2W8_MONAL|nr:20-hydroxyecdysone protein-like [Monopterus albus]
MEAAIQSVVKVFLKASKGKESLGRKEFQSLVKTQLCNILSDTDSKEAVNNMAQSLDANQDGKVAFEEFMKLVGYLSTSLSEQRVLAAKEPSQNAASAQVAQSAHNKEEEKPEAKAEAKEEAKPEVKEEAKPGATAEVKVDANADKTAEVKVVVKAEGETQPQAANKEPAIVVVPAAGEAAAASATVEMVIKEENKVVETEVVVGAAEKLAAAVEAEVEKTEEAAS